MVVGLLGADEVGEREAIICLILGFIALLIWSDGMMLAWIWRGIVWVFRRLSVPIKLCASATIVGIATSAFIRTLVGHPPLVLLLRSNLALETLRVDELLDPCNIFDHGAQVVALVGAIPLLLVFKIVPQRVSIGFVIPMVRWTVLNAINLVISVFNFIMVFLTHCRERTRIIWILAQQFSSHIWDFLVSFFPLFDHFHNLFHLL